MRYERPQRGREREFWQLNADLFGADGVEADAEIIVLSNEIMKAFGAKSDMYKVKINNRQLIDTMMHDFLKLDPIQAQLMVKLFDRKSKITNEAFRDQAIEIFGSEHAPSGLKKIADLLMAKGIDDLPAEIVEADAVKELKALFKLLKKRGVESAVFDITLMRGFDYYTGTVFEFFDANPENNRSMFGGGRYDGLVGLFGAEPISAVGVAPGLSTTELFLASHNLLPEMHSTTQIYVVVLHSDALSDAQQLAAKLRAEGVNTEIDFTGRKIDKQIKTAIKKQIPFMVFIGENETKKQVYNLKDTVTSKEDTLSFERMVSTIKDRRRHQMGGSDDLIG
jgi:histidyl-tRNA synthetase